MLTAADYVLGAVAMAVPVTGKEERTRSNRILIIVYLPGIESHGDSEQRHVEKG